MDLPGRGFTRERVLRHFRASRQIRPRDAEGHYALAGALLRAGRSPEAVVAYGRALQSRPGWGVAANALARQWAAGADPRVRDPEAAVKLAEQVNRAIGRRVPELLDTLAVCYAAVGRFDDAVAVEREAVGLAREAGRVEYAAELESRLKIFLEDRVWIEPH